MVTRRIVVRRASATTKVSAIAANRLQSIANKFREISRIRQEIDALESEIVDELKGLPMGTVVTAKDGTTASMYVPPGRSSTVVDARMLRKLLKDDKEFYDCISVGVTQARKYLSTKTLDSISDHLPATPGRPELKIKMPK